MDRDLYGEITGAEALAEMLELAEEEAAAYDTAERPGLYGGRD
jgi:hypothetical protein